MANNRSAALVWLKDMADSEVGFRDGYTPEEDKKYANTVLTIMEELEERIAIMAEGGDAGCGAQDAGQRFSLSTQGMKRRTERDGRKPAIGAGILSRLLNSRR